MRIKPKLQKTTYIFSMYMLHDTRKEIDLEFGKERNILVVG